MSVTVTVKVATAVNALEVGHQRALSGARAGDPL
jgi:hypothetical protein